MCLRLFFSNESNLSQARTSLLLICQWKPGMPNQAFLLKEMEWKKVLEWGQLFYNKQGFGQFSQPQRTKLSLQKSKYIKHKRDLLIITCLFSPLTNFSYWQYLWTCNITDKMILNKDSYKGHPPGKKNTISAWRKYLVILQRRFENLGFLKSLR